MRYPRRVVRLGLVILASLALACGGSQTTVPVLASQGAPESGAVGEWPPRTLHPRVRAAMQSIEQSALRADLERVVGPREVITSREHHDAVAAWIEAELRAAGYEVRREPVEHGGYTADNIVAERAGTDPSRLLLVGAHYDSVPESPGADDNASGVAAMLSMARAAARVRTRASLRFVAFCFEEDGMVGSAAHVAGLDAAERERLVTAITLDMLGYRTSAEGSQSWPEGIEMIARGRTIPTTGDFIGAYWLSDTPTEVVMRFEAAAEVAPEGLRVETLSMPRVVIELAPDVLRSDHASFWRARLPAISVGDTGPYRNPHYHRATDTLDTLDLPFLADVTRWLTGAVLMLAEPAPRSR